MPDIDLRLTAAFFQSLAARFGAIGKMPGPQFEAISCGLAYAVAAFRHHDPDNATSAKMLAEARDAVMKSAETMLAKHDPKA